MCYSFIGSQELDTAELLNSNKVGMFHVVSGQNFVLGAYYPSWGKEVGKTPHPESREASSW